MEAQKARNPAVPRAPRAKPRANSCGALNRALKEHSNNSSLTSLGSGLTRSSESRRPAAESPFSHARVNALLREREAPDNQVFEMGPRARCDSVDRNLSRNHARSHSLGQETAINQGMPWTKPQEEDEAVQPKERKHTLRRERQAADQNLEWAAIQHDADSKSEIRSHARVNINQREKSGAAQTLEFAPAVQVTNAIAANVGAEFHGRRNVLARETAEESTNAPITSGLSGDGGVPNYSRKQMLPPCIPRVAAH